MVLYCIYFMHISEDASQVSMDPPNFMLALLSMMDTGYDLWRQGIPFARQAIDELGYE